MDLHCQSTEQCKAGECAILHYRLDFQQEGAQHHYIWRYQQQESFGRKAVAMLVDIGNIHLPDFEIDKMIGDFLTPASSIVSIAFANCHPHNRQEIKRKLKVGNVTLYSKTAFFSGVAQAKKWLEAQCI